MRVWPLFPLLFFFYQAWPQTAKEAILRGAVSRASNDAAKIDALNELAAYYYLFKLDEKADSVLNEELVTAELSNRKDLVFRVLFSNSISGISAWSGAKTFDRTEAFLNKGLDFAKESGQSDYEALAYLRIAGLYRKRKEYDKAIEKATLAFSALGNGSFDSLRTTIYLELGDIFQGKGDALSAYRNYNNAFDLAYNIGNVPLQSETYHRFSSLYQSLGNTELAKENLLRSLELNLGHQNQQGLMNDYIDLAKLSDEIAYIHKAMDLAARLHSDAFALSSKKLMLGYIIVVKKDKDLALSYLEANPDLKAAYSNLGQSNYYWIMGNIYKYSGNMDSALYYYNLAQPGLLALFDRSNRQSVYMEMAECYNIQSRVTEAISFYERTLALDPSNLSVSAQVTQVLSRLYSKAGDFRKAFQYAQQHQDIQDTLHQLAAQRDVTLLEMEREKRQLEKEKEAQDAQFRNKRNLQYMSISIAIAGLFFMMILLGMFPVSKFTIKLLGYFFFICLFEFIVLLIDTYLHGLTHGEPLKQWLIKIFLIALLVPFQHFLEHGLIRFIQSRRLQELRSQISVRKWWAGLKKPAPVAHGDIEEDTAVL